MNPGERRHAFVRLEAGLEGGLRYQISADLQRFASLIWEDPFLVFFHGTLARAHPRFDPFGVCEISAASWIDVARVAEETEDRLRVEKSVSNDVLIACGEHLRSGELSRTIRSAAGRSRICQALQLTSFWLRAAAARHPTLTFYGA